MPMLTASQVHIDQPLTNLTVAWLQTAEGFIADRVFPKVSVAKKSDKYYIYDRGQFNRTGDVKPLAPRTEVPTIGMKLSTDSYFADVYGLATDFDFETLANEDAALQLRTAASQMLTTQLLIDREIKWANTYFTGGVWSTDWDGVSGAPAANQVRQWSDYTNSNPIIDVTNIVRTMQLRSGGFKPNVMVIGKEVFDVLLNHPIILARLNGGATVTNTALITQAKLAEIFGMAEILIMDRVANTAAEGLAENNTFIGGKAVAFYYRAPSAGLMMPSAGYTFVWSDLEIANGHGISIQSFTGDYLAIKGVAEKLQAVMAYDHKVVSPDCGAFIDTVIA